MRREHPFSDSNFPEPEEKEVEEAEECHDCEGSQIANALNGIANAIHENTLKQKVIHNEQMNFMQLQETRNQEKHTVELEYLKTATKHLKSEQSLNEAKLKDAVGAKPPKESTLQILKRANEAARMEESSASLKEVLELEFEAGFKEVFEKKQPWEGYYFIGVDSGENKSFNVCVVVKRNKDGNLEVVDSFKGSILDLHS